MFNKIFSAFLKEASFTKEILGIGVTQLYKANYATKGIYYQSFVCLSTGIERLEKLCIILDYYVQHNGMLPQEKYVRQYGHKISELYTVCQDIAKKQAISFRFCYRWDSEIRQSIIDLLESFTETSGRYSNINILLDNEDKSVDCVEKWYHCVDLPLYDKHVSSKKKMDIEKRAFIIGNILNQYAYTMFITEENEELTNTIEASKRTGIWEAVAQYRQLYILQIIRYLVEILADLRYKAEKIQQEDIPDFLEIFALFYNDNSYFRSRKTWDNL